MEYLVNQQIKLAVAAADLTIGLASLPATFLVNGDPVNVDSTSTEIGSGLYTLNFIPTDTGKWSVFVQGQILEFEVVSKTLQNALGDVLDESLGSWVWQKAEGLLTLFKADGSILATYNIIDTADEASRERVS